MSTLPPSLEKFLRTPMLIMYNNSIATSTFVKKSFKVVNNSISFCTKLSQRAGFFLNASVLFLSTKIFVENLCRDVSSLFKWQNIPPSTQAYSSTFHPKKILSIETSFLLKTVFLLFEFNKTRQNSPF